MKRIKPVVTEKYRFKNRDESNLIVFLETTGHQDLDARNKIDVF